MALWLGFGTPALAVIATTAIDFVATIPTRIHAWRSPGEETASTFAYSTVASICTLAASTSLHLTELLPPGYLLLSNGSILVIILVRRRLMADICSETTA